jgi:hypothetical protein
MRRESMIWKTLRRRNRYRENVVVHLTAYRKVWEYAETIWERAHFLPF